MWWNDSYVRLWIHLVLCLCGSGRGGTRQSALAGIFLAISACKLCISWCSIWASQKPNRYGLLSKFPKIHHLSHIATLSITPCPCPCSLPVLSDKYPSKIILIPIYNLSGGLSKMDMIPSWLLRLKVPHSVIISNIKPKKCILDYDILILFSVPLIRL
jgi:hypothetical protein